jgi:hypothetical protein
VVYLPLSALRVASVALRNPVGKKRAVALTAKQFRYGFGNALSDSESAELYERWTIPSPAQPLLEAAVANLSSRSPAEVKTDRRPQRPAGLRTAVRSERGYVVELVEILAVRRSGVLGIHGTLGEDRRQSLVDELPSLLLRLPDVEDPEDQPVFVEAGCVKNEPGRRIGLQVKASEDVVVVGGGAIAACLGLELLNERDCHATSSTLGGEIVRDTVGGLYRATNRSFTAPRSPLPS